VRTNLVTREGVYPLSDYAPEGEGLAPTDRRNLRAQWTGEPRRAIRAGEWYLSGAEVAAYRARADIAGPYHPARLVVAEPVQSFNVRPLPRVSVPASAL
jgi:hypothetical protein